MGFLLVLYRGHIGARCVERAAPPPGMSGRYGSYEPHVGVGTRQPDVVMRRESPPSSLVQPSLGGWRGLVWPAVAAVYFVAAFDRGSGNFAKLDTRLGMIETRRLGEGGIPDPTATDTCYLDNLKNNVTTVPLPVDDSWEGVFSTTMLNLWVGLLILGCFSCLRTRLPEVYHARARHTVYAARTLPAPPDRCCCAMQWSVNSAFAGVDATTLLSRRRIGMDGYLLLRFTRLCFRFCVFGAFWGCCVLVPLYVTSPGGGAATGVYRQSLANLVTAGGSEFARQGRRRLWAPITIAWLLLLSMMYELRAEYYLFASLRQKFLAEGDPYVEPQARYSVIVEDIPKDIL